MENEKNYDEMDSVGYDVLKEIGNIGAGNATTALSQMIQTKVDMEVPVVKLLPLEELPDLVGGAENILTGILFHLDGDVEGMIMFVADRGAAVNVLNLLFQNSDRTEENLSDLDMSALNEIGNIIVGAYLSSLSGLTGLTINTTVPSVAIDMAGAILSVPAIEFGMLGDNALLIQSCFKDEQIKVNGYFILIPTMESYKKIMKSLGM